MDGCLDRMFRDALRIEWLQLRDEGKDVERFREFCEQAEAPKLPEECGTFEQLHRRMEQAETAGGYPYDEPSDLEGIRRARPAGEKKTYRALSHGELTDKVKGGWLGRIAGCLLGKPVEGYTLERLTALLKATGNHPLSRYICKRDFSESVIRERKPDPNACWADSLDRCAPQDDDTNYTVLALKAVTYFGTDLSRENIAESWLAWMPPFGVYTAERAAYRNLLLGLQPPETAVFCNPYREWIGAQIRADLYGYIHPGNCERAAELAWRDASVSHVKNGIYGEMFTAAVIACAMVSDDVYEILKAGLREIPASSRLSEAVRLTMHWHAEGKRQEDVITEIHRRFDEKDQHGWCHVIPNAMIVATALLYGEKDFGRSVCIAVGAAFDTDCNGATVGSVVGAMNGAKKIPAYWTEPFGGRLTTAITGMTEVTVDELTDATVNIAESISAGTADR